MPLGSARTGKMEALVPQVAPPDEGVLQVHHISHFSFLLYFLSSEARSPGAGAGVGGDSKGHGSLK